jgi:hypothetical protein
MQHRVALGKRWFDWCFFFEKPFKVPALPGIVDLRSLLCRSAIQHKGEGKIFPFVRTLTELLSDPTSVHTLPAIAVASRCEPNFVRLSHHVPPVTQQRWAF